MPEYRQRTHAVPSSDRAFGRVVEWAARGVKSPGELESRLRPLYPEVSVSTRVLSGEPQVFYVYRHGRFVPDLSDRWWTSESVACVRLSATTGRLTGMNEQWADLIGTRPDNLVGRHYTDFVLPEARKAAAELFESIKDIGEVRSEALLRRTDGARLRVEFYARRRGESIEVFYRPSPYPSAPRQRRSLT